MVSAGLLREDYESLVKRNGGRTVSAVCAMHGLRPPAAYDERDCNPNRSTDVECALAPDETRLSHVLHLLPLGGRH